MNIFRFELRSLLKSTLVWTISLTGVCALMMGIFPAYQESADVIRSLLKGFPPVVLKAMGINLDTLFGVTGFYSFLLLYITLVGGVQAAGLGIGVLSRESREKNSDFLLTKPVRRGAVVTSKLGAALASLVITNILYIIVSVGICIAVADHPPHIPTLILLSLTLFFVQLSFLCIGAAVSVFFKIKSVNATALILVVIFFAISFCDSFVGKEALKYLTPFQYFNTTEIALRRSYDALSFLTVLVVCAVCMITVYVRSIRRDIPAV